MVRLINEQVYFMSAKAHENNLTITTNYFSDNISYCGDKEIVQRAILNIFSNAIKSTYAGSIDIAASVHLVDNKQWLVIKITDTGIGIDEANHKSIFEPFYRVEPADSAKFAGIGLGLSNANLMLKKIGGRIRLKSAKGIGSEFSIYLPITD